MPNCSVISINSTYICDFQLAFSATLSFADTIYFNPLYRFRLPGSSWITYQASARRSSPGMTLTLSNQYTNLFHSTKYEWQVGIKYAGSYIWYTSIFATTTTPTLVAQGAYSVTANSAKIDGKVLVNCTGKMGLNCEWYSVANPGKVYRVQGPITNMNSPSYTYTFTLSSLLQYTKYKFQISTRNGPVELFSPWLDFYTGIRSWKYRAFGVKPDGTDVYGEYKYFDHFG